MERKLIAIVCVFHQRVPRHCELISSFRNIDLMAKYLPEPSVVVLFFFPVKFIMLTKRNYRLPSCCGVDKLQLIDCDWKFGVAINTQRYRREVTLMIGYGPPGTELFCPNIE